LHRENLLAPASPSEPVLNQPEPGDEHGIIIVSDRPVSSPVSSTTVSEAWQPAPVGVGKLGADAHCWLVDIDDPAATLAAETLSSDEAARAAKFRFGIHRGRFVAARSARARRTVSSFAKSDISTLSSLANGSIIVSRNTRTWPLSAVRKNAHAPS